MDMLIYGSTVTRSKSIPVIRYTLLLKVSKSVSDVVVVFVVLKEMNTITFSQH